MKSSKYQREKMMLKKIQSVILDKECISQEHFLVVMINTHDLVTYPKISILLAMLNLHQYINYHNTIFQHIPSHLWYDEDLLYSSSDLFLFIIIGM